MRVLYVVPWPSFRELIRDPITRHPDFPGHLNRSWLKFDELERETLTGSRGNPIRDVVFLNGCGTDRWPAQEILMPQAQIGGQIVVLNVAPIYVLQVPERLLVF